MCGEDARPCAFGRGELTPDLGGVSSFRGVIEPLGGTGIEMSLKSLGMSVLSSYIIGVDNTYSGEPGMISGGKPEILIREASLL